MVKVKIPATTANLGPGFDCIGMALTLYNTIQADVISEGLIIEQKGKECSNIDIDENNLVYRAIKKAYDYVGKEVPPLHIILENNIPITRGLGSSAAAVVGGIKVANELLGRPLSLEEILDLATEMEGHPDNVAPALYGGIVLSIKENKKITTVQISPPDNLKAVALVPNYTLSTQLARQVMPDSYSLEQVVFNTGRLGLLVSCLERGDLELLKLGMEDCVHQPYRSKLIPGFDEVLKKAKEQVALGVALSGAGPTIIAFCQENEEKLGKEMQKVLQNHKVTAKYLILEPDSSGCQLI